MGKGFQAHKATVAYGKRDQHAQRHRLVKGPGALRERVYYNPSVHYYGFF